MEPTRPPTQGELGTISPWVKQPKREADYYIPSNVESRTRGALHASKQNACMA
jgi:hypothetical protein